MSEQSSRATEPALSWAELAGAPSDASAIAALIAANPAALTGADLVDAIVASEKALSLLTVVQMRLLCALAQPFVAGDPTRLAARLARKSCLTGDDVPDQGAMFVPEAATSLAAAEVGAALRISPVTAGVRIRDAITMTTDLMPTLCALEEGRLDRGKARVIADQCKPLAPEHVATVQELVLPTASDLTTSELREITGLAVITVDPDGAEKRHQAAATRRELTVTALPDAMASLKAFVPADGAVKIFQVTDLLATGTAGAPDDPRSIGARRVDALVDIADQLLTHGELSLNHYLGAPLRDSTKPGGGRGRHDEHDTAATTTNTTPPRRGALQVNTDSISRAATLVKANLEKPDPVDTDPNEDSSAGANFRVGTPADSDLTRPDVIGSESGETGLQTAPDDNERQSFKRAGRSHTRQGRRPHLSVTIPLSTLAGLSDLPGMLSGFGAIPAGLARGIALSASTITALLNDPTTGLVTAAGALTHRPSQELRDRAGAISDTCRFPSCRQPAWRCDIDHRIAFDHQHPDHGGRTDIENTEPLCRRHHLFKHHADWHVRPAIDQITLAWTSPTNHRYRSHPRQAAPPQLWITTTATAIAEQLDTISAPALTTAAPASASEELLTSRLLRHGLNCPQVHLDLSGHIPGETIINNGSDVRENTNTDNGGSPSDDPPPF